MHWLQDLHTPIVFLIGAAGCGKTALAVAAGAKGLDDNIYDRVLLTRVNEACGKEIGFLKGTEAEKNMPWIAPMIDEFEHWIGVAATK